VLKRISAIIASAVAAFRSLVHGGTMSAEAKSLMDAIEKSYQFYVYLFTVFVVFMGVARWYGKQVWRKREESRRESNGLPVAALLSGGNSQQSFTYTGLFQGGLTGVCIAVMQLSWVVLMLGYFEVFAAVTSRSLRGMDIWHETSILMFFPILMIGLFALIQIIPVRSRMSVLNYIFPVGIVLVVVAGAVAGVVLITDKSVVVTAQFLAVAILSLCASYFIGMSDGIHSADPESNYPLVSVELNQGGGFDQVWLYERTDSDYRLVTKNGTNHIVPTFNVKKIRKL
jgi:hypothetical protein